MNAIVFQPLDPFVSGLRFARLLTRAQCSTPGDRKCTYKGAAWALDGGCYRFVEHSA